MALRHCSAEQVKIYEGIGESLPALLRDVADKVEELEAGYANVAVSYDLDNGYLVTLYQHY